MIALFILFCLAAFVLFFDLEESLYADIELHFIDELGDTEQEAAARIADYRFLMGHP